MRENILATKSYDFSKRIVKLYQYLCAEKREYIMSKQVLRSGTSIGANITEAEHAQGKRDFVSKLSIALKEADETRYWLRLLADTAFLTNEQGVSMLSDCDELIRMLAASVKTAKQNLNA